MIVYGKTRWVQIGLLICTVTFAFGQAEMGKALFCKSADGLRIGYSKYGKGDDLIVLVHGWSCDKSYWKGQVSFFERDFQVVTIDLGGHGISDTTRKIWTVSSFGDDVVSVLNTLTFRRAVLVGHSMGGLVVMDAASKFKHPDIKLILVDMLNEKFWPATADKFKNLLEPMKQDFEGFVYKMVKGSYFSPDANPDLVEWVSRDMSKAPPHIAIPSITDLLTRNYDPLMEAIRMRKIPRLLLNAGDTKNDVETFSKLGFDMVIVPQVGHFIMMEKPDEFNSDVIKYFTGATTDGH